jgi:glycine cleavage system transcriptional repressor
MKKVIISVVGRDRPGIIAAVARFLFDRDCNVENVSQTILQNQFSGIFIAAIPPGGTADELEVSLADAIAHMGLFGHVRDLSAVEADPVFADAEPFVISTKGPDQKGLVARITEVIADHGVNVTNLQAVFKGGDDPDQNIMIYEVDIPQGVDRNALQRDLRKRAAQLELDLSIQHRNIFEAIHRI